MAVAAACTTSSSDAPTAAAPGRAASDAVVVASFNFPESVLVAEIYAIALEQAGVPVRRELDLGPRELVTPALFQGFVDVVPEYVGTALAAAAPSVAIPDATDTATAHRALAAAIGPMGVRVLTPAPAQNQNAVVVTAATAARLGLATVSDLAPHAAGLRLGGPPECPSRRYCAIGLRDVYGLRFDDFIALNGATRTRRALEDGVIDVGIMFTTDGYLAAQDLVLLLDDRHLQPPENIVPVAREDAVARHGDRLTVALDDVSARLTTTALRLLNWRVSVAGRDPSTEARGWLTRQGVLPR